MKAEEILAQSADRIEHGSTYPYQCVLSTMIEVEHGPKREPDYLLQRVVNAEAWAALKAELGAVSDSEIFRWSDLGFRDPGHRVVVAATLRDAKRKLK